jgi:hypothetical protein
VGGTFGLKNILCDVSRKMNGVYYEFERNYVYFYHIDFRNQTAKRIAKIPVPAYHDWQHRIQECVRVKGKARRLAQQQPYPDSLQLEDDIEIVSLDMTLQDVLHMRLPRAQREQDDPMIRYCENQIERLHTIITYVSSL